MNRKKQMLLLIGCLCLLFLVNQTNFQLNTQQTSQILGQVLLLNDQETKGLSGRLLRMSNVIFAMEEKQVNVQETVPTQLTKTDLSLRNQTSFSIDIPTQLNQTLSFLPVKKGSLPQVLIVHTHTSEAYQPLERTSDESQNVVEMGELIAKYLKEQGVAVIHDKTVHDDDYNGSYARCLETVEATLKKNPSIQIVLDVHRDAAVLEGDQSLRVIGDINGTPTGQIMLVVGTNEGGLSHPNWESNLSFALRIQQAMEEHYPGLARPLNIRKERFNQQLAPGMLIVEVAASGNSLKEAKEGAKLFAKALWMVLQ